MSTIANIGKATGIAPMFLVDDVIRTAEWYRDHLGFEIDEYFRDDHGPHDEHDVHHPQKDEPVFVIVLRDGHSLMLGRTDRAGHGVNSNHDYKEHSSDAYLWVEDIEALFEAVRETGARFAFELAYQPYGLSEFQVIDCDGRHITFGGPPET